MYQSLRELRSNFNTSEAVASSAPGEISLNNYHHPTSTTSNSSDYTDEDEEDEGDGSSSGGMGSFRRRRRIRYMDPIGSGSGEGSDAAPANNNNNTSSSRTLPSIRESCLSTCKFFSFPNPGLNVQNVKIKFSTLQLFRLNESNQPWRRVLDNESDVKQTRPPQRHYEYEEDEEEIGYYCARWLNDPTLPVTEV